MPLGAFAQRTLASAVFRGLTGVSVRTLVVVVGNVAPCVRRLVQLENDDQIEHDADHGGYPGAEGRLEPRKYVRVVDEAPALLAAAYLTIVRLRPGIVNAHGGGAAERDEEGEHERHDHLAVLLGEQVGHLERREDGTGALGRRDHNEPHADERGRLRNHLNEYAKVVDGHAVDLDHVGRELEHEQNDVRHGHADYEHGRVRVAHAFRSHHHYGEHVAHCAEYEQNEQRDLAKVPWTRRLLARHVCNRPDLERSVQEM